MWGLTRSKIHLVGIPDTEEKEKVKESLKSVMAENFSERVQDITLQIQKTWWNPCGIKKRILILDKLRMFESNRIS